MEKPSKNNHYILLVEDITEGQEEYDNLDDLMFDINSDLLMIGFRVCGINRTKKEKL